MSVRQKEYGVDHLLDADGVTQLMVFTARRDQQHDHSRDLQRGISLSPRLRVHR